MMVKVTYIIIYLVFLVSCSKSQDSKQTIIDCTKFIHRQVKLSEFADDIFYVKLSPEIKMEGIRNIQVNNANQIYISIWPSQIAEYDFNGNLIKKIGKKGRGPGEYKYCNRFALDPQNDRIFILDFNKILNYSLKGIYINKIDFTTYDKKSLGFDNIGYKRDNIYLFQDIAIGQSDYNWLILNLNSEKQSEKLNSIPSFKSLVGESGNIMYEFNNHFCYWNHLNDTIFEIFPDDTNKVRYLFAKNKQRLASENFVNQSTYVNEDIFVPNKILEANNYLFLSYSQKRKSGYCLYDKDKCQFFTIEKDWGKTNYGFVNDLDGGVNFQPQYLECIGKDEYLIGWVNSFQLKDYIATDEFESSKAIKPQKKKDFEELADSLKEDDNPVLIFIKLKH